MTGSDCLFMPSYGFKQRIEHAMNAVGRTFTCCGPRRKVLMLTLALILSFVGFGPTLADTWRHDPRGGHAGGNWRTDRGWHDDRGWRDDRRSRNSAQRHRRQWHWQARRSVGRTTHAGPGRRPHAVYDPPKVVYQLRRPVYSRRSVVHVSPRVTYGHPRKRAPSHGITIVLPLSINIK